MKYNIEVMDTKTFNHIPVSLEVPDLENNTDADGTRQYTLPNGDKYYSVTTVTGFRKNAFFKEWREKNPKEMTRVLKRGNILHRSIEKYLKNEEDFLEGVLPNEYILFEQALPELNQINNVCSQETALWSDTLTLAGRVDCVAEYNGKLSIIDFKGATKSKRKEDINNYFMQATAYAIMWQERTGNRIDNVVIIITSEDGTVNVFESNPLEHTKELFRCIRDYKASLLV